MSDPLRILMMGTGKFAVPSFGSMLQSRHEVVGLVTQPDRIARGGRRHANAMKDLATDNALEVFQPDVINDPSAVEQLTAFEADLFVVAAYGQILSAEVLATPRLGAVNIHASLLPKYRGAAPIQHAILQGETVTGITVFQIEPRLDAGPVLGVEALEIGDDETYGELEDRLAKLASELIGRIVDQIADGTTNPVMQDQSQVTRARSLKKEHGLIDWSRTRHEIHCHIRGMQPWPRPFTFLHRPSAEPVRLLILEVDPKAQVNGDTASPGLVRTDGDRLYVSCSDGWLSVCTVQPGGKKTMSSADFLRGNRLPPGSRFGAESND